MLTNPIFLSLLFGFAPPVLWLTLWLQEDAKHPEPASAIIKTFFLGGAAVLAAIVIEGFLQIFLADSSLLTFLSWAVVEEGLKLLAVIASIKYFAAPVDEPIDWIIYMITAALGFAAIENVLFLMEPFSGPIFFEGVILSNLRFIGATVLHLIASATHGSALALCFYLSKKIKRVYYVIGFSLATIVHMLFNFFLVTGQNSVWSTVLVFGAVWLLLLPLILIFEKVKTIRRQNL